MSHSAFDLPESLQAKVKEWVTDYDVREVKQRLVMLTQFPDDLSWEECAEDTRSQLPPMRYGFVLHSGLYEPDMGWVQILVVSPEGEVYHAFERLGTSYSEDPQEPSPPRLAGEIWSGKETSRFQMAQIQRKIERETERIASRAQAEVRKLQHLRNLAPREFTEAEISAIQRRIVYLDRFLDLATGVSQQDRMERVRKKIPQNETTPPHEYVERGYPLA